MDSKTVFFKKARWISAGSAEETEGKGCKISEKSETGEVVAGVCETSRSQLNPLFRKSFRVEKEPVKAVLTSTAIGVYRAFINGECISEGLLDPGWTDYETRLQVQTCDVTEFLKKDNRIEILAAGGWACGALLGQGKYFFSPEIQAIAELRIGYADGTEEIIYSDESWEVWQSCLVYSSLYNGEIIDWSLPARKIGNAVPGTVRTQFIKQEKEPVTAHERIRAVSFSASPDGKVIVDFGQNLAGYAEIHVRGKKGDRICIRHGEVLDGDGDLYVKNLRTAEQRMVYVLGKDGESVLRPYFSYQGFRYILLEEYPAEPSFSDFYAVPVYTDMKRTGDLICGNEKINRLYRCILWNQRSNFLEVPTDCPQRDERLGWLGDAQVFCRSASFNYDVYRFYQCWLRDVKAEQLPDGAIRAIAPFNRKAYPFRTSAAWADAVTIIPYTLYLEYGDTSCMEEMFPCMCRYVDYMHHAGPEEYLWIGGNHYGDWLALDGPDPRHPLTDKDFIASAYFFRSTELTVKCGKILGKEVKEYEELLPKIRSAFRERFLRDGLPVTDTEAACALLLSFDLLLQEEKEKVCARLCRLIGKYGNRLMCGVVGAPLILNALSENGCSRKAYDMLLEESTPSWLGMIRYGATTLWERPDTYTEEGIKDIRNASFNHYMFGSVLSWITGCAGGLRTSPDKPGYEHFIWEPQPDRRIGSFSLSFCSRHGKIEAGWAIRGGEAEYRLRVPEGTEATVRLPGMEPFERGSGTYQWSVPFFQ